MSNVIGFDQVANPSFADSNKLLEMALAQSAKATEGLQATLGTAVGNVEDANHAKIQQLINSQTREQLQDPEYQKMMEGRIQGIVASTGNTYDPLKMQEYGDNRIKELYGRETTESNLHSAEITQNANKETNAHNQKMNQYIQENGKRVNMQQGDLDSATRLAGTMSYFDKSGKALDKAIAANEKNPAKLKQLLEDKAVHEQERDAAFAAVGNLSPYVQDLASQAMSATSAAEQKRNLGLLKTEGEIANAAQATVNATVNIGSVAAKRDADTLLGIATLNNDMYKFNASQQGKEKGYSQDTISSKKNMSENGFAENTIDKDGNIDFPSFTSQLLTMANKAAATSNLGDGKSYLEYASGLGTKNKLNDNQMRDLQQVMEGRSLPDYQKKAFLMELQLDKSKRPNWYSNKGAIEKSLGTFLKTYNTSDAAVLQREAMKGEYRKGISALTREGLSAQQIAKYMGITNTWENIDLMPKEIQDVVGFTLDAFNKHKERKSATAENRHTTFAADDFAKHEREWKIQQNKGKTATDKWKEDMAQKPSSLSPFDWLFGNSPGRGANEMIKRWNGNK